MRNPDMTPKKRVICISWNQILAESRELLLRSADFPGVMSALYQREARSLCREDADLMILGDSVPRDEKRWLIDCFRQHSSAPVLSLLCWGEIKLPEATIGVEATQPEEFIRIVRQILEQ
jgi:hypothetical protein